MAIVRTTIRIAAGQIAAQSPACALNVSDDAEVRDHASAPDGKAIAVRRRRLAGLP